MLSNLVFIQSGADRKQAQTRCKLQHTAIFAPPPPQHKLLFDFFFTEFQSVPWAYTNLIVSYKS